MREAARLVGELLDELRLPSALMTTGSRGLHVVVPLDGRHDFDEVREFAKAVADTLTEAHPEQLTTAARKKDRGDRLYLDIQRNAYAQTSVAPFTVRAKPGAPVATPLTWEQLDDPGLGRPPVDHRRRRRPGPHRSLGRAAPQRARARSRPGAG